MRNGVLARRTGIAPGPHPRTQHDRADHEHEQPRDEVHPRIEILRQQVLRQRERHDPEREDADRVRHRDGRAEHDGVAGRAAGADEVRGDHRLAVTGGQRVQGAPAECGEQQQDQRSLARRGVVEAGPRSRRLPARRRVVSTPPPPARGATRLPSPGATLSVIERSSAGLSSRARGSCAGDRVGSLAGRLERVAVPSPARGDDRAPAETIGERGVAQRDLPRDRERVRSAAARRASCAARPDPWETRSRPATRGAARRRRRRRAVAVRAAPARA